MLGSNFYTPMTQKIKKNLQGNISQRSKGSQFYNDENSSLSYETSSKLVSKKKFC